MPDDEIYDHSARLDDHGVLEASDTLEGNPGDDALGTENAPPDRWSVGEGFGTTAAEEQEGESLARLLAEEEPDVDPYAGDDERADPVRRGTPAGETGEQMSGPRFDDGPDPQAGQLVSTDGGIGLDEEPALVARYAGRDVGAASAEEAAVHMTGEDDDSGARG